MGCCNDEVNIIYRLGEKGVAGLNGWTPLFSDEVDGERVVQKIIGWYGGGGNEPPYTNYYLGNGALVTDISLAVNIRGGTGATGASGLNGWSSIKANVVDGERVVQQIVDWVGGQGTKPSTTNQFIGPVGIVSTSASATNIRGPKGDTGDTGAAGADITDGRVKVSSNDTGINYLENKITSDGTVGLSTDNDGSNETLRLTTGSEADDYYSEGAFALTSSYQYIFNHTTANDGITRKYKIDFNAVGNISVIDGTGRTSGIRLALFIDGVEIKAMEYLLFTKSGSTRAENSFQLTFAGSIPPNKVVSARAKISYADNGSPVTLSFKSMSVFGIR